MKIHKYFLGIGSNIEPRRAYMHDSIAQLEKYGKIKEKSSLYESEPWGNKDQEFFYNAVIEFESELKPNDLLIKIKSIEQLLGRVKSKHWGPRNIDIDILLCDDQSIKKKHLQVPHKLIKERQFVLQPIAELTDEIVIEGQKYNTEALIQMCPDNSKVNKLNLDW